MFYVSSRIKSDLARWMIWHYKFFQVKETFGPQLQGDVTLKDLQQEIFKVIPVFLNLNDKEGFEDDSFFEAKANPVDVMKQVGAVLFSFK